LPSEVLPTWHPVPTIEYDLCNIELDYAKEWKAMVTEGNPMILRTWKETDRNKNKRRMPQC
jgi:hypothetical protein